MSSPNPIAAPLVRLPGTVAYAEAFALQQRLQREQIAGARGPVVLFVEHRPVITIGRRGTAEEVVAPKSVLRQRGVEVHETDRGGQVTYHGPGQLVVYPLVQVQALGMGLHEYLRALEEAVILALGALGLSGYRVEGRTGVWVGQDKICAMGIRVRHWWAMHGLALNVTTNLNHFGLIVPCGIRDRGVTSLEALLGPACPPMERVEAIMARTLGQALGLELESAPPAILDPVADVPGA